LLQNLEDMDVTYKALQVKRFVSLFLFCWALRKMDEIFLTWIERLPSRG
jgi:hypothetical protein